MIDFNNVFTIYRRQNAGILKQYYDNFSFIILSLRRLIV